MGTSNKIQRIDYVYWSASTRKYGFEEHVKAAKEGEFTSLAIAPETYKHAISKGITAKEMVMMASDAGTPIRHFDTITDWTPIRYPSFLKGPLLERFDVSSEEIFEMVDALEVQTILAFPGFELGSVPQDKLISGLANLCDEALKRNIRVDLEFAPFLGLPNLESAYEIVKGANRVNSGLLIDLWHFIKGNSSLELLSQIPGQYLKNVQVTDGYKNPPTSNLIEDGLGFRAFAGEGDLPILAILKILKNKGSVEMVGPETFSNIADGMTPEEAGKKDGQTVRNVISKLWT